LPDNADFVKGQVTKQIFSLIDNKEMAMKVCDSVQFIPTVVDRIVTKIAEKDIKKQLKSQLLFCLSIDSINTVRLDQQITTLIDQPERLVEAVQKFNLQFTLFNAEKS